MADNIKRTFFLTASLGLLFWIATWKWSEINVLDVNKIETKLPEPIPGVPYQYPDEVKLRFIVMVYNRAKSLQKCLNRLNEIVLDPGVTCALEIWVDRSKEGRVDRKTLKVAEGFNWWLGPVRVHVWPRHVGVYGQWIDTWRPAEGSTEAAVFLEDDIDVSPYIYKWLKAARETFHKRPDIGDIALSDIPLVSDGPRIHKLVIKPKRDIVYLYPVLSSLGMSPFATPWRKFQDWFHNVTRSNNTTYHPYTPAAKRQTAYYKLFEKQKKEDSMWSMWYIHFCNLNGLFTLHSNLAAVKGKALAVHRREKGLHFSGSDKVKSSSGKLLLQWKEDFIQFPMSPVKYNYSGIPM